MKGIIREKFNRLSAACLIGMMTLALAACGSKTSMDENLVSNEDDDKKIVNLFGPMEKSRPNVNNIARTAFDLTVEMAEEELDLIVRYRTYTAENYQEKSYDDVALDRVRNQMDDLYLLNQIGRAHV